MAQAEKIDPAVLARTVQAATKGFCELVNPHGIASPKNLQAKVAKYEATKAAANPASTSESTAPITPRK